MTIERPGTHLAALDAVRGILAPIVVVAHVWQTFVAPVQTAEKIAFWSVLFGLAAKLAVFSFFTLSGFVIALTIQRNAQRNGRFDISEFAIARAFRILPPLLAVLLVTTLLEWALGEFDRATPVMSLAREEYRQLATPALKCFFTLCATGTLVRDVNGPLWSLEAEIQLYVIAGLASWFLCSRRPFPLIALAFYLIASFRPLHDGSLSIQPASYAAFALGWVMQRQKISPGVQRLLILAGLAVFGSAFALMPTEERLHLNGGLAVTIAFLGYAVASAAMIPLVAGKSAPWLLVKAGGFSYTLYIVHFPLLLAASFVLMPAGLTVAVFVGLVVVFSAAGLGFVVERPRAQRQFVSSLLQNRRGQPIRSERN